MKRIITIALVIVLGAVGISAPAQASEPIGIQASCSAFSFCLWDGINYVGDGRDLPRQLIGGCFNLGQVGFSNRADSGINNTGFNLRLYDSSTCGGSWMWWPAGTFTPNFNVPYGNNRISGVAFG